MTTNMTRHSLSEIDLLAIQRLLSDFAWQADHGDAHQLALLFLHDGVLRLNGTVMEGQAQIEADCGKRFATPGRKTRHVWSNLRVQADGPGEVSATNVQMTFEQGGAEQSVQARVSDVVDLLSKGDDGRWRFRERTIGRVFALGS